MKLFTAVNPAPNPRRVHIFLAEKGLSIERVNLSILKGEQKDSDFINKNSRGQVPVLELDDGTIISESVSICRYFDEIHPDASLFGNTPLERAQIDMAVRRIEFNMMGPVGLFWAHAHPFTARVVKQFTEFGESNRARWEGCARWLNAELTKTDYVAGSSFSMADIVALTTIDFAVWIGLPIPEDCSALISWHKKVSERPSVISES
jgi:glutathione S-transferase